MLVAPGCIVHLPLTTVGVCVDPPGIGQVYVGGVDGNVHVALDGVMVRVPGIVWHKRMNSSTGCVPALKDIVAVHVPSVSVAVWPPTVGGTHVAVGGVGGVTVVLPSEQVTATAQADR